MMESLTNREIATLSPNSAEPINSQPTPIESEPSCEDSSILQDFNCPRQSPPPQRQTFPDSSNESRLVSEFVEVPGASELTTRCRSGSVTTIMASYKFYCPRINPRSLNES